MTVFTRRKWLGVLGTAAMAKTIASATGAEGVGRQERPKGNMPLDLKDFQPKSMLHVPETKVLRSRFPVIDIHTHLCWIATSKNGIPHGEKMEYLASPEEALPVMERKNIRTMVNLTGGFGAGLREAIQKYQAAHPGRFLMFVEPRYEDSNKPGYGKAQADDLARAQKAGAKGLKVLKTLGLYLRENVITGPLVKIDDRRFDPMWEACAALRMPVAIHISDPEAFFLPIDRFNERFEELNNHPDWSFYGSDFPSNAELLDARNRVFARHPKTQFVALHVGNDAENLPYVSECMDRYPNMHVELGARIGELGRQPRMARKFFDRYQDRTLFGTDAVPHGDETPQQIFGDALYEIYYRFLETEDEYFDYAPAPVPPQGRWRIYGLGLPESMLKKVYYSNAARLLGLPAI
jgi:predicted TIM-barrel fold metal-dependent hydrolase